MTRIATTILYALLLIQAAPGQADEGSQPFRGTDGEARKSEVRKIRVLGIGETIPIRGATGDAIRPDALNQGVLWRISGTGPAPSHLFGTMHIDDPRVMDLPKIIRETFDHSDSLTLEADLDLANMANMALKMMFPDGRTLRDLLDARLYVDVQQLLAQQGIPDILADRFKPWAVAVLLSTPRSSSGMFLDRMLYEAALQQNKPIHGLETLEEQVALFDELSQADQIRFLRDSVEQYARLPERIEELTQAYLQRDLEALARLSDTYLENEQALATELKRRVVVERNIKMADKITDRLRDGNAFIAVGALHLPGRQGLLRLLKDRGLRVEPVY